MQQIFHRDMAMDATPSADVATGELEFSASSDVVLDRGMWQERLVHDDAAVDLSRFQGGAGMLLYNHDWDRYLGKITHAYLDSGKMRVRVKFAENEYAQEKLRDIQNGILTNVSIGYSVEEDAVEMFEDRGAKPFFNVKRWQPHEVSIVTVPADISVGIGRALLEDTPPISLEVVANNDDIESHREHTMEPVDVLKMERERIAAIVAMQTEFSLGEEWASRHISQGTELDKIREDVIETLRKQAKPAAAPEIGLDNKEKRQYSLVRLIRAKLAEQKVDGWRQYEKEAGLEQEASEALYRQFPDRQPQGVLLPLADLPNPVRYSRALRQRLTRLYSGQTGSAGGNLIDTVLDADNFIEALRAMQFLNLLGARYIVNLVGDVDIPRRNTVGTVSWVGEGVTINTNDSTFDKVSLNYKQVAALSYVTRRMLLQATPEIEELIRFDMMEEVARAVDAAAIRGTGGAQPTGILNLSGTGEVTIGANGGELSWQKAVEMTTKVAERNALTGSPAFLMGAKLAGKLYATEKAVGTAEYILDKADLNPPFCGSILMYPALCTNLVPENLTKGTGTNLSALIFGDFSQVIVGEWGPMDFVVNPYGAGFQEGNLALRIIHACDIAFRRPEYFSVCKEIDTTP